MSAVDLTNLSPVDEDLKLRMLQFTIDCNDGKGNAYACHSAAEFLAVIEQDHAKAAKLLEKNCDGKNNYGASCFKLGRFFLVGKGVEANDEQAFKRFEKACDNGISAGCHFLGMMLEEGKLAKDAGRARQMFTKACENGDPESCFMMGQKLLADSVEGSHFKRDPPLAMQHLNTACRASHAPSCRLLAVMFKNGDEGVEPDVAKFEEYKQLTTDLVQLRGSMMGMKVT
jgi:TPR repeat protein